MTFPCRLPFNFNSSQRVRGGRARAREAVKQRARNWINACFAYFSFLEAGLPSSNSAIASIVSELAAKPLSQYQQTLASNLLGEVLPFCRARKGSPLLGRGLQSFKTSLSLLSSSQYSPFLNTSINHLTIVAKEVLPSRLGIPEMPGTCDPRKLLVGSRLEQFENLHDIVSDDPAPISQIRACHLVEKKNEFEINTRLLKSNMCVLVSSREVARDVRGKPLVGGLFAVSHKDSSDRLINDRRPLHETELSTRMG